jgi:hypothetical protein
MPFLDTLKSLDAKATPSPWECDDGEGYSLLRIRAASRTVAEVPGDDAMTGPTGALLVLLRNHAARIAAVVESVAVYKAATDAREAYDSEDHDPVDYAAMCVTEAKTYRAMLAALAALEAP